MKQLIEQHSIPEPNSGCWLWMGPVMNAGYGRIYISPKTYLAHRVSYEAFRGPIPERMQIDHLCECKICVNPEHLSITTFVGNTRRWSARRKVCKNGHELIPENLSLLSTRNGQRCRLCHIQTQLRYQKTERFKKRRKEWYASQ